MGKVHPQIGCWLQNGPERYTAHRKGWLMIISLSFSFLLPECPGFREVQLDGIEIFPPSVIPHCHW